MSLYRYHFFSMSIDTISYYIQCRLYPFIFGCKIYKDVLILPGTESNCLSAIGAGHIVFPTDEKNMLMSFIGLKRKVHARMSWLVFQHSILAYDDTITEEIYYRIYSEIGGFLSGKAGRGAVIYSNQIPTVRCYSEWFVMVLLMLRIMLGIAHWP